MSFKSNRHKKVRRLSASLPEMLKDKGWERKYDQHRVFIDWETLVDETTAEHARPLKVVKDVLWLEVENSSWMQQFQYQKLVLLENLNAYLRLSRFSDIRFVVEEETKEEPEKVSTAIKFVPPPSELIEAFEKQISCIEDEKTRDALMRLWYLSQACRRNENDQRNPP